MLLNLNTDAEERLKTITVNVNEKEKEIDMEERKTLNICITDDSEVKSPTYGTEDVFKYIIKLICMGGRAEYTTKQNKLYFKKTGCRMLNTKIYSN